MSKTPFCWEQRSLFDESDRVEVWARREAINDSKRESMLDSPFGHSTVTSFLAATKPKPDSAKVEKLISRRDDVQIVLSGLRKTSIDTTVLETYYLWELAAIQRQISIARASGQ